MAARDEGTRCAPGLKGGKGAESFPRLRKRHAPRRTLGRNAGDAGDENAPSLALTQQLLALAEEPRPPGRTRAGSLPFPTAVYISRRSVSCVEECRWHRSPPRLTEGVNRLKYSSSRERKEEKQTAVILFPHPPSCAFCFLLLARYLEDFLFFVNILGRLFLGCVFFLVWSTSLASWTLRC
ncbi:hypothetical protein NDU88_008593 [Pleurodeles waltl]|uniref:Uncharacterized protein n=1 Tax=Pleurodeles waltl TaxID=8319 RepID=A0AAV7P0Q7_PLEWA|nr:hypothetical protein NDU88_008593 [Pleurodeles waltl]